MKEMGIVQRLKSIKDFGGIDAGGDQILLTAFEDHASYLRALDLSRPFIIGRKGSGKSAIFQKITRQPVWGSKALGFTFSEYPWNHHGKQKQVGVPDEECYKESWKYFIYLMFCKLMLSTRREIRKDANSQEAIADIEVFVRDSYGSTDPNLNRIFTPGQRIKLSGRLNFWKAEGEVKTIDIDYLPTFYAEVNNNILDSIVCCIPKDLRFYVCFDELDLGFDPKNADYIQRLVGLIRAAKYTNDRFRQEGINSGVIILLRDDIWETLRFENKNHIAQGSLSEIKWSQEDGPHCLKKLMERRFENVLGDGSPVRWEQVFDESKTMARFQTKYDFICMRTFLRPRDSIRFCNEVLTVYQTERGGANFQTEHVKGAEANFSRYMVKELEDELHKHSKSYENYFEVLKNLTNVTFSLKEFEAAWWEKRTLFDSDETPLGALEALFDFSVIGFLSAGGRAAGSRYVWRYLDPRTRFNGEATAFRVHMGLKQEFELKLYSKKREMSKLVT